MEIRPDHKIAVLGAGVEGRAAIDFLLTLGCTDITVCDKDEKIKVPRSIEKRLGDDYLAGLSRYDVIFRSPGIPRDLAGIIDAEDAGVIVTSVTREFFDRCPCTVVGVTGTNGKTTTTELIAHFVRPVYSSHLWVGGNDREPLIGSVDKMASGDLALLELSSFQLEDLHHSPNVSVVTNVAPNHLNQHSTLEEYFSAKANIVRYQSRRDFAVLNYAFTRLREFSELTQGMAMYFNSDVNESCSFVREGRFVLRFRGREEIVAKLEDMKARTNPDNVLAAMLVAAVFGVDGGTMAGVLRTFEGVEHRIEHVREIDQVTWYNDSSSTTPESAVNALLSFPQGKVILLAGGSDKLLDFTPLAEEILRSRARVVLYGQTASKIAEAIEARQVRYQERAPVAVVDTLEKAIKTAQAMAEPRDVVVLSPACASFDQFTNSKERGKRFKRLVLELRPESSES